MVLALALAAGAGPGETVFAGFDFPLGLPEAYATAAGIDRFIPALSRFGRGRWSDFYSPADTPDEISIRRPFYPNKPGGTRHKHLTDGLGVTGSQEYRGQVADCVVSSVMEKTSK